MTSNHLVLIGVYLSLILDLEFSYLAYGKSMVLPRCPRSIREIRGSLLGRVVKLADIKSLATNRCWFDLCIIIIYFCIHYYLFLLLLLLLLLLFL